MPRNLSAKVDLGVGLGVIFLFLLIFLNYSKYIAAAAMVVWLAVALWVWDRQKERERKFLEYCENIVGSGQELMHYAMINIPQATREEGKRFNNDARECRMVSMTLAFCSRTMAAFARPIIMPGNSMS